VIVAARASGKRIDAGYVDTQLVKLGIAARTSTARIARGEARARLWRRRPDAMTTRCTAHDGRPDAEEMPAERTKRQFLQTRRKGSTRTLLVAQRQSGATARIVCAIVPVSTDRRSSKAGRTDHDRVDVVGWL
jgi:hypothetical protein